MSVVEQGQIKGSFRGFRNRDTLFEFNSGRTWKQNEYKNQYQYAYRPTARVVQDGGRYYLEVDCMNTRVEVKRA